MLEGLPEGWEVEAVPRTGGQKHIDFYWYPPPDPVTHRVPKKLRSLNEVRAYLNPESIVQDRAKRHDHDREQVRKVLEALIAKVEKRCEKFAPRPRSAGGGVGRARIPQRSASDIMREPLSAFMLYSIDQHSLQKPAANADLREVVHGYGQKWLDLTAESREEWELMATHLEPPRCKLAQQKADEKRKHNKKKKLATKTHDSGRGHEDLAQELMMAAKAAPSHGRSTKRSAAASDSAGGKRSRGNEYAAHYSGSAARRATQASDSPPPGSEQRQPEFGAAAVEAEGEEAQEDRG